MKKDDLNGRFQNLYDKQIPDVPNRVWEKVDEELFPKKKRNGMVFWLSIFTGLVILTGTWLLLNDDTKSTSSLAIIKFEKKSKNNQNKQSKTEHNNPSKTKPSAVTSKINPIENKTSSTNKNKSYLSVNSMVENKETVEGGYIQNDPFVKNIHENNPEDENLASIELISIPNLPLLPITLLNTQRLNLVNLSTLLPTTRSKEDASKFTLTAGIAFGKNIRYTNSIIDPELSVSKLRGDNRMALNLIQVKCGIIYNINDKYSVGLGANYGFASRKSPWYTRPTYFAQGQQELVFQTLEGRYNITDAAFLNSLVPNDTNNINLKNSVSIKMFSIPLTVYRHFKRNNWTTSLNAGLSADIHFGKDFHFELEQNNTTRQLSGILENQTPIVSLQGLLGSRFSYLLSNSFNFYFEPQLSIPISSYLSTNNQNSYSASLTIGAGISYKF